MHSTHFVVLIQHVFQTYNQFKVTFKNFGIGVKWVTEVTPEAFAAAIDDRTKAIYIESISNPKYILNDIPTLAKVRRIDALASLI